MSTNWGIALAVAVLFATAGQAQEEWSGFQFSERIHAITDEVTWIAGATNLLTFNRKSVLVVCWSTSRSIQILFDDGEFRADPGATTLKVRFDKDPAMEFLVMPSTGGDVRLPSFVSGLDDVRKVLGGLRTKTRMAFQIADETPVVVPLTGSTTAMAKLDAKCSGPTQR